MPDVVAADVAIIGTGAGGGTLAYALKNSGAKVVLLERGGWLPSEPANWSPAAVFGEQRYKADELRARLRRQGLHPYSLPLGIDLAEDGTCIRCGTCDGFPCRVGAKSDADVRCVRPAIATGNVTLRTETFVDRLETSDDGSRVTAAACRTPQGALRVQARTFVVSCGA